MVRLRQTQKSFRNIKLFIVAKIIKIELEALLRSNKYSKKFLKLFIFIILVIDYFYDKIFLQFLRIIEFTRFLNYYIDKIANVLYDVAKMLIKINIDETRKMIAIIRNYYQKIEFVQNNYIIRITKSLMLQIIIASFILDLLRDALNVASKNTIIQKTRIMYAALVRVIKAKIDEV